LHLTVKVYDVARARTSKPHIHDRGLQGEGNVGEARAAARRTPCPPRIKGRSVNRRLGAGFIPHIRSSLSCRTPGGQGTKPNYIAICKLVPIDSTLRYNYTILMKDIHFEWDESKNTSNLKKHSVSFEEAKSVFYDPYARLISDPEHSESEDRFIILGLSRKLNVLVVCHCYRKSDEVIRIISARKATKQESSYYGGKL
jgi:uncharacterized protein